jgi:hypothetical protein
MSYATIRAQIKTTLDAVTNVGQTHDYMRWAIDESAFIDIAKTTISSVEQVRVWFIDYGGFTSEDPWLSRSTKSLRVHSFMLHGYMGLDDSAETAKTFATVCNDLEDDATLNAPALSSHRDPCQLVIDHRMFYQKLCHHAQITFLVAEIV